MPARGSFFALMVFGATMLRVAPTHATWYRYLETQAADTDCGASALATALRLRGIEVSRDKIEWIGVHPKFIDHVINLACGNGVHDARAAIEVQRDEVSAKIQRLTAVAQATDGDIHEVMDALKARKAERDGRST
jgi:hypothetical protein